MRRALGPPIILFLALLGGCTAEEVALPAPPSSECRSFEIAGTSYRMLLPEGSAIEPDAARGSVLIRPKPKGRLMRFLSIAPLAGATVPPPTDSTILAHDLEFSYSLDENIGGGSGGPEAELVGEMLLDARTPIMIVCRDQQEGGANAKWCFEPLETLAPEASPKACK